MTTHVTGTRSTAIDSGRWPAAALALRSLARITAGSVADRLDRRVAVAALRFDEVFHRMRDLYLAYSEAGFRSGNLDVYQWTFAPTGRQ